LTDLFFLATFHASAVRALTHNAASPPRGRLLAAPRTLKKVILPRFPWGRAQDPGGDEGNRRGAVYIAWDDLAKAVSVVLAVVGFIVWLVRIDMRSRFNESNIVKLNMDMRKQSDGLGTSLGKFNDIIMTLSESISELKGIISEMRRKNQEIGE